MTNGTPDLPNRHLAAEIYSVQDDEEDQTFGDDGQLENNDLSISRQISNDIKNLSMMKQK